MPKDTVEWMSAAASAFAALVALTIPFIMQRLDRQRLVREERAAVKEVCVTITQIVRYYKELRDSCAPGKPNHIFTRYHQIASESQAAGMALERMLSQSGWTDGVQIAGSAAIVLAQAVAEAGSDAGAGRPSTAGNQLPRFHHVAQLANSRCERVRTHFNIERDADDPIVIV
ncbi:hypothetical protein [Sphingobium sp. CFD-2]|uniref:hypothetical protein n=1 Tax=Sphingobium sp. CFD-2 TaxID=2878542 RepID=UPI00214AC861|nr:hypothetical protein [Sphingobium sp. CFD-2]